MWGVLSRGKGALAVKRGWETCILEIPHFMDNDVPYLCQRCALSMAKKWDFFKSIFWEACHGLQGFARIIQKFIRVHRCPLWLYLATKDERF